MQRMPVADAPSAAPVKPSSEIGVSTMRSPPNSWYRFLGVREGAAALAGALAEIDQVAVAPHLLGDPVPDGIEPARLDRGTASAASVPVASGGLSGSAKT